MAEGGFTSAVKKDHTKDRGKEKSCPLFFCICIPKAEKALKECKYWEKTEKSLDFTI